MSSSLPTRPPTGVGDGNDPLGKISIMTLTGLPIRAATEASGQHVVHVDGAGAERAITYAELQGR